VNAGFAVIFPRCDWCGRDCTVPEDTRRCECRAHEGEELTFCGKSCKVAAHA